MSYIDEDRARRSRPYVRPGQLFVLESTTYPGTTEEVVKPHPRGARGPASAGVDFFLAFSPEREDPGNPNFNTKTIPKIVGGYTPAVHSRWRSALYASALTQGGAGVSARAWRS